MMDGLPVRKTRILFYHVMFRSCFNAFVNSVYRARMEAAMAAQVRFVFIRIYI